MAQDPTPSSPPAGNGPARQCDVVMKGGITSGIVYPKAMHELQRHFRFRSIGGTSAGAIAAAATAAAEYGRQRGRKEAFDELEKLPEKLGEAVGPRGESRLFMLFRPQPETAPLFRTLVAGLRRGGPTRRVLAVLCAAAVNFLPATIFALLVVGGLAAVWTVHNLRSGGWSVAGPALAPAVLLTALGILGTLGFCFFRRLTKTVPKNFYGLCSGYASPPPAPGVDPQPLTGWLHSLFQSLAGLPADRPLTFGDLWWGGPDRPEELPEGEPAEPALRLQMMTTNLSHGRPYRLPFLNREQNLFFFKEDEFTKLFPEAVVRWMKEHPRKRGEDATEYPGFLPLPPARDLPVIVATRMSLSFPFLIGAIPLYALDYSKTGERRRPERCWFSDGGIASNFPVHFFDGPLPRWPTFAINLRPYHPEHPEGDVYKPPSNRTGTQEWWTTIDRPGGFGSIAAFFNAINDTMQNWADNAQIGLPGYRDRVVHVSLKEDEGGMNLNMPPELIKTLGDRGRKAAARLCEGYTGQWQDWKDVELSWDNHRWVRLRTLMALLEDQFTRIGKALQYTRAGDRSYEELILRGDGVPPKSYSLDSDNRRREAAAAVQTLARLSAEWEKEIRFGKDEPKPEPELRVRPRI